MNDSLDDLELKQLKSSDVKSIRTLVLKEQGFTCAICGKQLNDDSSITLDHQHRVNKKQRIGEDGAGLVRGCLCRECNVLEGKIWNNSYRYKQLRTIDERVQWLEKLILYYKKDNLPFIHPSEKEPEKNVSKRQYNKLKKLFNEKYIKRFPMYPKSGKLTKDLYKYFNEFGIDPYK